MEHILVTGSAGFIGSFLVEALLKKNYKVTGIDNLSTGSIENVSHLLQNPLFHFIQIDIRNNAVIDIFEDSKIDAILHFASPASPIDFYKIPIDIMTTNSIGTYNLLELAVQKKAVFMLASTSEVYGDPLVHPQPETYWGNVNPIGVRAVYDEAKRFAEALTMAYHRKYGLKVKIVRIFNTYGPRMRVDDGRVVINFIIQALQGKPITIYGAGTQTRSFCYVDDLVDGIIKFLEKEDLYGEVINLGNPEEYKIIDLANKILEITGSKSKIKFLPPLPDDPRKRRPDISKAKKLLGWEPKVPLEEGLKRTINYFKEKLRAEV